MGSLLAQGLLLAKGPGVMKGYYNDEAATAKAFVAGDGWFDTGDLGWRAPSESPSRPLLCPWDSRLHSLIIMLLCCMRVRKPLSLSGT